MISPGSHSKDNITRYIFRVLVFVLILTSVFLSGTGLFINGMHFWDTAWREQEDLIQFEKEKLQNQVASAVAYIQHEQAFQDSSLNALLQAQVQNAHTIATHIYNQYHKVFPRAQVESLIIEAIRPLRFNGGRGYFFITRHDGVEMLFADRPELEGKNLLPMQSGDNKMVIKDMITISKSPSGQGFYEYKWSMPNDTAKIHLKKAFIKNFAPFNWFIGTGEYLESYEKQRQQAVLQSLEAMQISPQQYLFVGTWEGTSLLGPAKGKNMWQVKDSDGTPVVQSLVSIAQNGGGFFQYRMPPQTGSPPARKISYTLPIPEWNWYIGTGAFVDDIEHKTAQKKDAFWARVSRLLILNFALLLLLLWASTKLVKHYASLIKQDVVVLNDYFDTISTGEKNIHSGDKAPTNIRFLEFKTIAAFVHDMVEQREKIAEQLYHSQKMDAIGQLAGGIAHDFNNSLNAIMGATEMLQDELSTYPAAKPYTDIIMTTSMQACDITQQLLTFSRKTPHQFEHLDICELIQKTKELLTHTLPKNIQIQVHCHPQSITLVGDAALLQNALINMAINSSHAMPEGGLLSFTAFTQTISPDFCETCPFTIKPGPYTCVQVSDTGEGIPKEIADKIFEPFYTTKPAGKGTGLGLATVYGTIKKHGGAIHMQSKVSEGTTFSMYLPL
jgi:signal transduction histidine kinase